MARPLPKMNAPALRKNNPSVSSVAAVAVPMATPKWGGAAPRSMRLLRPESRLTNFGGASQTTITRPAAMNRSAISAPVSAVTVRMTTEITHSRTSRSFVSLASFTAAKAMIAMTAGATP